MWCYTFTLVGPSLHSLKLAFPKLFENISFCLIISQSTLNYLFEKSLAYFAKLLLSYF
jgi:hypothetical protein